MSNTRKPTEQEREAIQTVIYDLERGASLQDAHSVLWVSGLDQDWRLRDVDGITLAKELRSWLDNGIPVPETRSRLTDDEREKVYRGLEKTQRGEADYSHPQFATQ